MVGSSSTLLEPCRSESESSSNCINSLSSSTCCGSLTDPAPLLSNENKVSVSSRINDSVTSNSCTQLVANSPIEIKEEVQIMTSPEMPFKIENQVSDETFVEMISEEVVITSEDLSLYDACDVKPDLSSLCSDTDIDERNIDQGYESIDSPNSDVDHSLSELFPDLAYQYVDSDMC